jgi:hypothetical protein
VLIASAVAIQVSKEALVIALEFVVQNDSTDVSSTITKPLARVEVCAVQLGVVRELSRLHDARVEGLVGLVPAVFPTRFEKVTSAVR